MGRGARAGAVCAWVLGAFVAPGVVQAQSESVEASSQGEVQAELSLLTTYVFRGAPQYVDDEVPSLQAQVAGFVPSAGGGWWGLLWVGTALDERDANAAVGRSNEVDVAAGYEVRFEGDRTLRLGAIGYFRPQDTPLDVREEILVRYGWGLIKETRAELEVYGALYGEVFRMLGAYAEGGAQGRWALEFGFSLLGAISLGGSRYFREGAEEFNVVQARVGLQYAIVEELVVEGTFNGGLTSFVTEDASTFLDRHQIYWSGITVRYLPQL